MSGLLPLCNIGDIKEGQFTWKAKVTVLEKGNIVCHKTSKCNVHKCLLQDAEGTTIEALMWDDNITKIKGALEPQRTYMIQGAKVEKIEDLHWAGDRTLEWSMIGRKVLELVTDENERLPYPAIHFTDLLTVQPYSRYTDAFGFLRCHCVHMEEPEQL